MRRYLALPFTLLLSLSLMMSFAAQAQAHASQTKTCTGCHGPAAAVTVSAVQTANNGVTATYNIAVNNPYGQNSWAVFNGSTKTAGAAGSGSSAVLLPVGKTYTVFGVSGDGNGTEGYASVSISPTAPLPAAPAAPVISATYPVTTSTVTISWAAVSGATSYDYQVGAGSVTSTTSTSVTIKGLASGTTAFKVRSANTGGTSAYSSASVIYTPPAIPAAPSISSTYSVSASTVTISWAAVSGATSYAYQVGAGSVTSTTSTSVTIQGLALGTTAFKVRSANITGASSYAAAAIVYAIPATAPGMPTLNATYPTTTGSVIITWAPVAGAASYDYQLGSGSVLSTTSTSVTLTGLSAGTTAFKVRATNGVGSSSYRSASVIYTLPSAPAAPVLNATYGTADGNLTITWAAVTGATSYDYQLGAGTIVNTTSTSVTLTGLPLGTTAFKLRATNVGGSSTWTSTSLIYTLAPPAIPAAPVLPYSADTANGSVTVSWATVPGATSYQYQLGAGPILTTTSTSVTLTGLPVGSTAFNVRSVNGAGTSAFATTAINYTPPAPATPVLDAIYGTKTGSVTISWAAVPGATAYDYQVESGAVVRTTSTSVTLNGLGIGSTSFALRASGDGGTGWWTTTTVVSSPIEQVAPVLSVTSVKASRGRRVTIYGAASGAIAEGSPVTITLRIKNPKTRKYRTYHYVGAWTSSGDGSFTFSRRIKAPKTGKAYFVITSAGGTARSRSFTIKR